MARISPGSWLKWISAFVVFTIKPILVSTKVITKCLLLLIRDRQALAYVPPSEKRNCQMRPSASGRGKWSGLWFCCSSDTTDPSKHHTSTYTVKDIPGLDHMILPFDSCNWCLFCGSFDVGQHCLKFVCFWIAGLAGEENIRESHFPLIVTLIPFFVNLDNDSFKRKPKENSLDSLWYHTPFLVFQNFG